MSIHRPLWYHQQAHFSRDVTEQILRWWQKHTHFPARQSRVSCGFRSQCSATWFGLIDSVFILLLRFFCFFIKDVLLSFMNIIFSLESLECGILWKNQLYHVPVTLKSKEIVERVSYQHFLMTLSTYDCMRKGHFICLMVSFIVNDRPNKGQTTSARLKCIWK